MDTIKSLLKKSTEFLTRKGISSSRLEAELLLADLMDMQRIELYTKFDTVLTPELKDQYRDRIQSRGKNKPTAQILGYRDFYKHRFQVTPDVLIPRPETEDLVETFLKEELPAGAGLLDLCCGTGCVGLSLLAEKPDLNLVCSDISPAALEVCRKFAESIVPELMSQVDILESDLFTNLNGRKFHAVLSNPPYIHPDERDSLDADVKDYEPEIALFHPDPEALYGQIITEAATHLEENGLLMLEMAPRWTGSALKTALSLYSKAEIKPDLAGIERYLVARL